MASRPPLAANWRSAHSTLLTALLAVILSALVGIAMVKLGTVQRVSLSGSAASLSGSTPATILRGFKSPLPVLATTGGALLVGDWTTGVIYRIARA